MTTTILSSTAQVRRYSSPAMNTHSVTTTGQIELYTHHPFLPTLVRQLGRMGLRTCAAYLIESQFMEDKYKFFRWRPLRFITYRGLLSCFVVAYSLRCRLWSTLKFPGSTSCQRWT